MNYQLRLSKHSRDEFLSLIYQAAEKPNLWNVALEAIAQACDAKAAIITLRSQKTCEVIISSEIADEFHTPFVDTLPMPLVEEYVQNFRTLDAWACVQVNNRPIVPTLMSRKLPIEKLARTEFWEWLKKLGVNDTVVAQIGYSKNYWTAFNLYFDKKDENDALQKLRFVEDLFTEIKRAWFLTREIQRSQNLQKQLIEHVQEHSDLIFLLNENGQVISKSKGTLRLINSQICLLCERTGKLSIEGKLTNEKLLDAVGIDTHFSNTNSYIEYEIQFDSEPTSFLATGENLGFQVIKFRRANIKANTIPWENPLLDERQKLLLHTVARTGQKSSGAKLLGITDRQSRNIWQQIEAVIGTISKQDLVILYKNVNASENS